MATVNNKSRVQNVKKMQRSAYISKFWGGETIIQNHKKYCFKLLKLNKGFQSSLHFHKRKDETFFVLEGSIYLELNEKKYKMKKGDFVRVFPRVKHRFYGRQKSTVLEVSTQHFKNDCFRLEKSKIMK